VVPLVQAVSVHQQRQSANIVGDSSALLFCIPRVGLEAPSIDPRARRRSSALGKVARKPVASELISMNPPASQIVRQLLRDEREPRTRRITALSREVTRCVEAKLWDAALVMRSLNWIPGRSWPDPRAWHDMDGRRSCGS